MRHRMYIDRFVRRTKKIIMKQLLLVLASVICICYTTQSFAQSANEDVIVRKQSIILDDKNNESKTTIEIKDGKLYVDGKKVSEINADTEVKIIKKNTIGEQHDFKFDFDNMDTPFAPKSRMFGVKRKAMLGVRTQDAQPGAEIQDVVEGSAADKAGLKKGDIIIAVDEENIQSSQDLVKKISEYDKGDEIKIQIERNGRADNLMATLEAPKSPKTAWRRGNSFSMPFENIEKMFDMPNGNFRVFSSSSAKPKLGIEVEESEDGIEVLSVQPNGAADKAGIQKGDEIKTIEGEEVSSLSELQREIARNKGNKKMYIGVQRAGAIKSLPVVLPRAKKRAQF